MLPGKKPAIFCLHTAIIQHTTSRHQYKLDCPRVLNVCLPRHRGNSLALSPACNFLCAFVNTEHRGIPRLPPFAVHVSLPLFWDVTQPTLPVIYRRFGTTYRSCLQGQAVQEGNSTLEDGNDRLFRNTDNIPVLRDWKNFCTSSLSLSVGVWLQI